MGFEHSFGQPRVWFTVNGSVCLMFFWFWQFLWPAKANVAWGWPSPTGGLVEGIRGHDSSWSRLGPWTYCRGSHKLRVQNIKVKLPCFVPLTWQWQTQSSKTSSSKFKLLWFVPLTWQWQTQSSKTSNSKFQMPCIYIYTYTYCHWVPFRVKLVIATSKRELFIIPNNLNPVGRRATSAQPSCRLFELDDFLIEMVSQNSSGAQISG